MPHFRALQLSFQMWTDQMQETLNSKKKGDSAFRHNDFRGAIEYYTKVSIYILPFLYLFWIFTWDPLFHV